jgi:hypothetical protein
VGRAFTVPVNEAAVAPLVRVNVLGLAPAELVMVMVGDVLDVGVPDTVPTTEAVVALVVRLNTFEGLTAELVMVMGTLAVVGGAYTVPM